jgi:hypothetical protein
MRKSLAILALSIASVFAAQSAKAQDACQTASNLVTNCGFETGDFTGWSGTAITDPLAFEEVDQFDPYSGLSEASGGPETGNDTLFQALSTVAGTTYTISFAIHNTFSNPDAGRPNDFSATFGSNPPGFSESNVAVGPYTVETFTGLATGSTTDLTFTFEDVNGFFDLDSVSVVAAPTVGPVPEPSSLMLLGTGALGLFGAARRRLKR